MLLSSPSAQIFGQAHAKCWIKIQLSWKLHPILLPCKQTKKLMAGITWVPFCNKEFHVDHAFEKIHDSPLPHWLATEMYPFPYKNARGWSYLTFPLPSQVWCMIRWHMQEVGQNIDYSLFEKSEAKKLISQSSFEWMVMSSPSLLQKLVESLLVRNFRHDDVALDPIAGEGISIGWRQC